MDFVTGQKAAAAATTMWQQQLHTQDGKGGKKYNNVDTL